MTLTVVAEAIATTDYAVGFRSIRAGVAVRLATPRVTRVTIVTIGIR